MHELSRLIHGELFLHYDRVKKMDDVIRQWLEGKAKDLQDKAFCNRDQHGSGPLHLTISDAEEVLGLTEKEREKSYCTNSKEEVESHMQTIIYRCKWCKRKFKRKRAAERHGVICGMKFETAVKCEENLMDKQTTFDGHK